MGRIKNQTKEQKKIHNLAVKIRKMSDEELVGIHDKADNSTKTGAAEEEQNGVKEFLTALETAEIKGIGKVTTKKIREFAMKNDFI